MMARFGAVRLFLVLAFCGAASAADFCAVRVVLKDQRGRPRPALVELRDAEGRTVERSMAPNGEASFCDFGFGPHSIWIAGISCAALVIPNVRVAFGKEQVFPICLNSCFEDGELLPRHCRTYFRVASRGSPTAGVALRVGSAKDTETDRYGRALVLLSTGETKKITFSKEGYASATEELSCPKPSYAERQVELEPLAK